MWWEDSLTWNLGCVGLCEGALKTMAKFLSSLQSGIRESFLGKAVSGWALED